MSTRIIGALWKRTSKDGKKNYLSGVINDIGGDIKITVFVNDRKEKENQPDYNITISTDDKKEPVKQADPFFGVPMPEDKPNHKSEFTSSELRQAKDDFNTPIPVVENNIDVKEIPFG